MGCLHISHEWKSPLALKVLMGIEFLGIVAALTLFGMADPNTYRTKLWQIGSDAGYCSSPNQILYAYANYRPIPSTPLVWSSVATQFEVVCTVFSMFVLLVKLVMFIMHMWYPLLSTIVNTIIVVLWIVCIYAQAGPDYSDAQHPMPIAWYISKSCNVAKPSGYYGYCLQAKGSFAVSIIMLLLFTANLGLSIYSMIPTKAQRFERRLEKEEEAKYLSSASQEQKGGLFHNAFSHTKTSNLPISTVSLVNEPKWEMQDVSIGASEARRREYTPYTPRTLAFNTLDRQLPLRTEQERETRFG